MPRENLSTAEAMSLHGPQVLQVIWNLVSSAEDAQDIFQETFLRHHQSLARGHVIDNPPAWLCATARHAAFRLRRGQGRLGRRVPDDLLAAEPAPTHDPQQRVLLEQLRDLVAHLPARQGQVFAMRNFEQMTFSEIARQLDITEEAARASAHKALLRLRSQVSPAKEEDHVG